MKILNVIICNNSDGWLVAKLNSKCMSILNFCNLTTFFKGIYMMLGFRSSKSGLCEIQKSGPVFAMSIVNIEY